MHSTIAPMHSRARVPLQEKAHMLQCRPRQAKKKKKQKKQKKNKESEHQEEDLERK